MVIYSHDKLLEMNESYHQDHILTEDDLEMANFLSGLVEATRNQYLPECGDIIEYTNGYGLYYQSGHVASRSEDELYICEQPYIPFVSRSSHKFGISTSTSGGAWAHIPMKVRYLGKRLKEFKQFGHCGGKANGAVTFCAEVNVWEYVAPDIEFSTKSHSRFELQTLKEPTAFGYRYLITKGHSSHTAFKTLEEYHAWLDTFHGVERPGFSETTKIIWTFKQDFKCVPLEEYLQLQGAVIDSCMNNGYVQECKRVIEGTSITTYMPYQNEKIEIPGGIPFSNARLHKMF